MEEIARLTEVTVTGLHCIQEGSPTEIAEAIVEWLPNILSSSSSDYVGTETSAAFANHYMTFVYITLVWMVLIRKGVW